MSPATALSRATIRAGSKARSCSEPHGKTFFRHGNSHPRSDHPQDYFPLLLHTNCISLDMPKACCFLLVNSVQQTLLAVCCSISGQIGESLFPLPETSPNYRVSCRVWEFSLHHMVRSARRRPRHAPQQQAFLSYTSPCF